MPNHYETLKIAKTANAELIKKAYRALSKQYHPDVNKANDAKEKFQRISEAYQVLSDDNKKKAYDARFNSNSFYQTIHYDATFKGFYEPNNPFADLFDILNKASGQAK